VILKKVLLVLMTLLIIISSVSLHADDIRGYFIPEYYVVASNNSEELSDQHGFWIRRLYIGYNTDLGNGWSAKVRLEMDSFPFEKGSIVPYLKNLHIKKTLSTGVSLILGIIEPPSFDKIEKFWGFRYIEKTAPDFWKFATSRDFGVAIDGKTKTGIVYTLMYGNYSSNKGETNSGKAVYGRVGYEKRNMYVEINSHFADDGGKNKNYASIFGGLKGNWGRFGVGYNHYSEKSVDSDKKYNGIISAFGVIKLSNKSRIFARYDFLSDLNFRDISGYLPVPSSTNLARLFIAGINIDVSKYIKISPNVKYVHYLNSDLKGEFYLNLTGKISFKTKFSK